MRHRDRVGEVWEGARQSRTDGWSGLHVIVKSEEDPAHPYQTRHTTLSLDRGAIRFANEPTDRVDGWNDEDDEWRKFL